MTPAAFVLAFVVCATTVGCHDIDMPANEMAKRSYQSYSPYNGTTQYYFDEIDDLDDITDSDEDDSKNEDDDLMYKNPRKLPSSECPRNEQQASFMGQECLRKCASDEDCKSKKKHCLCDGICGMSCVKPERECDELPHPEHGQVIMTGRLFSDKATYTCELGYQLIGRDHRICHASGSWSGSNPYCKQSVFCKSPPVIENAVNNAFSDQQTFDVGSEVEYQCKDGFSMRGFAKAKCLAMDISASWYGPEITCEPRTCGSPPVIANGWHQGECSDFGCRVFYKCADQYELIGKSERLCHSDGYWVPKDPPSCVPVDCGPPENPFNGNAVFTSTSYNSVVSYECKFGSLLTGEPTRRCGADGKWSGTTPTCQEIDCGSPGELHNGWLENTESGTGLGATIIYRCQDGMLLVGNSSTVCLADGNWRYPPPLCLAPCVVPVIQHGGVNISLPNGTIPVHRKPGFPVLAKHGDKLIVKCDEKYEPEGGNSTLAACNNGTWTFIPKCEPAHCKRLPKIPKNGIVLAPYLEHGSKAKFACKDGYVMNGSHITECQYGNWSGKTPKCEEVYCPFPGYIQHGKVLLVGSMGVYDYRPYVKKVKNNKQIVFECDKEYTLETGPVGATCIDGKWCPEILPKCMPLIHPKLRLSRSIKNDTECNDDEPATEETNYSLITNAIETIKSWWTRSKRALSAQNQQVMKAKQTSNKDQAAKSPGAGRSRGRESGDTIFKDYDGEEVNATVTATGEKNIHKISKGKGKHLKRKVGPCEPLSNNTFTSFEVLKLGKHGNVTHSHGTIIKVTCKDGYHSNVINNTAKCWRTHWKPAKPDCKLKPCLIPYPGNGYYSKVEPTYVNVSENAEIVNGEVLVVTCLQGFNLKGPSRITCMKGEWDVGSAIPECTPAPCELPAINHGQYLLGYRAGLTIANGSFVTFQCDPEFIKTTSVSIECVLGRLVPKLPSCKRDGGLFITGADILKKSELGTIDLLSGLRGSCGPPESVQGSLVFRNGELLKEAEKSFPDGTEITFNCIGNIIGEKVTWRIRCEDGNWIGRPLNCIPTKPVEETNSTSDNTTCMFRNSEPNVITFIGDSMITNELTEFNAGTVLVSRCSDIGKYAMEGSNKRVCINGEWSGQRPVCFGLNQENDYALEKPPTILFRHQLGPIAQSNEGKLVVYPGTILHMECLWIKRFGTPKWNISHSFRKYPEGWTTDPGRDPDLEYRLSIYHASRDDSGVFSCITPTRHMHSVEIIVKAVHCPSIPLKRSLTISTQNTKLNARVKFTCAKGNNLMGASEVVCLPSGNWSDPIPSCEIIECDEIENLTDPNLRVAVLSRQVGGEIMFSCMQGFGLTGPTHSICLPTGEWEQPFPTCAAVTCPWPGDPPHGYLAVTQNSYRPGERVSVNCEPYYVLDGQPNLICQDDGNWSAPLPTCVQACPYPGTVIRGRMSTVKFYYAIGDVITFSCDDNFHLKGASVLKCLKYGKWSNSIPTCVHKNETLLAV